MPGIVTAAVRLYLGVQQASLIAVTSPTAGTWFELLADQNGLPTVIDWEVAYPSAPTTPSVQLEGTDDPTFTPANVYILDGPYTGLTNTKRWVVDKPTRYVRANCTAIAGGSVTVNIKNSGKT